jgi:hypothetical protein
VTSAVVLDNRLWWYTARAAGISAWVLVSASVLWGVWLAAKPRPKPRPSWVRDLHTFLGGLACIFTAVHLVGLFFDAYVHFGPSDLFVPLATRWHPVAVSWGIVGMYLLAAVELTSLAMRWLPHRIWRSVHLSAFALFGFSTVHLLTAGTDRHNPFLYGSAIVMVALVVSLTAWRALIAPRLAAARRDVRAATIAAARVTALRPPPAAVPAPAAPPSRAEPATGTRRPRPLHAAPRSR